MESGKGSEINVCVSVFRRREKETITVKQSGKEGEKNVCVRV